MKKLTLKERKLVKEYAKKLMKEMHEDVIYFAIDNEKLDQMLLNDFGLDLDYKHLPDGDVLYCLNNKDWQKFQQLADDNGFDEEDYYELDSTGHEIDKNNLDKMESKKIVGKKILKENNTYTMVSALREITDDLLLQTELLIDKQYGKVDHNDFKNAWYKNANQFENKFKVIIKSLMKTGK